MQLFLKKKTGAKCSIPFYSLKSASSHKSLLTSNPSPSFPKNIPYTICGASIERTSRIRRPAHAALVLALLTNERFSRFVNRDRERIVTANPPLTFSESFAIRLYDITILYHPTLRELRHPCCVSVPDIARARTHVTLTFGNNGSLSFKM